jgi:hypothetical protein
MSHPLAATTNSGVVANGEDASRLAANYYGILKKWLSTRFVAPKSLKLCFLNVIALIQSRALESIILVWSRWSMNRAIQAIILCCTLSAAGVLPKLSSWNRHSLVWCICGKIRWWWCHSCLSRRKWRTPKSKFHCICGAGLTELATRDVELMEEESGPSKKCLQKSK